MIDVSVFGIEKVTTDFFVNEDERTVACVITTKNEIPLKLEKYGLADDNYDDNEIEINEYRGVAKCAPEDPWDERYGMKLAEYRAQRKRQTHVNGEIKKYIKDIQRRVDNLYDYGLFKDPHYPEYQEVTKKNV